MKSLAVFGTGSDVGKTTIVMALCRIFSDQGIKVAPFKAQNVSNNSAVTQEDREISRAQCLQADAARIAPSYLFNPVLMKSHGDSTVQIIVNGLVHKKLTVSAYYEQIDHLKLQVQQAFSRLQQDYDLVIAEGSGSPVELNLLDKDLSNSFIATTFNTKNVLVADIERGGVFASIYGTMALMDPVMRSNLIGVVINKFRGDRSFFEEGEKIINERFGLPVLGVLPFQVLNIDMEDSQSLKNYQQRQDNIKIHIAVIAYPGLSNYNDLDVLMADPEIFVELIFTYRNLIHFDMVLLPGSKTVISDMQWLKQQGLFEELQKFNKPIFGICGGYQMFCLSLHDPDAIEHNISIIEPGLEFIDDIVLYQSPKIIQSGNYQLFSYAAIKGYEIHYGQMGKYPLFFQRSHYAGTHVHGVFDDDVFRGDYFKAINSSYLGFNYAEYKEQQIQSFTDMVADNLDTVAILQALQVD
jgi:adenosylcobyric acid synthase